MDDITIKTINKVRRGTYREWQTSTYVLEDGEFGLDTDNRILKIGNGKFLWDDLEAVNQGVLEKLSGSRVKDIITIPKAAWGTNKCKVIYNNLPADTKFMIYPTKGSTSKYLVSGIKSQIKTTSENELTNSTIEIEFTCETVPSYSIDLFIEHEGEGDFKLEAGFVTQVTIPANTVITFKESLNPYAFYDSTKKLTTVSFSGLSMEVHGVALNYDLNQSENGGNLEGAYLGCANFVTAAIFMLSDSLDLLGGSGVLIAYNDSNSTGYWDSEPPVIVLKEDFVIENQALTDWFLSNTDLDRSKLIYKEVQVWHQQ